MRRMTEVSSLSTQRGKKAGACVAINSTSASPAQDLASDNLAAESWLGMVSVAGRSREMEDALYVRTNLCRPEISNRQPVHFFAVYDGHGGSHVAALCRQRMHVFMEEELMREDGTGNSGDGIKEMHLQRNRGSEGEEEEEELKDGWKKPVGRSFERMDEAALNTCACGSLGSQCGCHSMEVALAGSTAVVGLLTPEYIIVGNCGDSRAVLCRNGKAIPLTSDHKPDRSDELARIEAAGGRVIYLNGARVEGILAMSRAIGDKYLKPIVSSEPEITLTKREPEDVCLILASDGLWDVMSIELACEVATECLRDGSESCDSASSVTESIPKEEKAVALYRSRSELAAALLTRLALGRRSSDNVTVIVVDLKRETMTHEVLLIKHPKNKLPLTGGGCK